MRAYIGPMLDSIKMMDFRGRQTNIRFLRDWLTRFSCLKVKLWKKIKWNTRKMRECVFHRSFLHHHDLVESRGAPYYIFFSSRRLVKCNGVNFSFVCNDCKNVLLRINSLLMCWVRYFRYIGNYSWKKEQTDWHKNMSLLPI